MLFYVAVGAAIVTVIVWVLMGQPDDAVVRTPRRVYLLGLAVGQTNAFFFDAEGRRRESWNAR